MKTLLQNAEIIFWDLITPLMVRSNFVREIIRSVYPVVAVMDWQKTARTLALTSISGFAMGWIIFYAVYLMH